MNAAPASSSEAGAPPSVAALVVDDEPANRDFLVRLLEQARLRVRGAATGAEALAIAADMEDIRLIVIDNKLPDMDGVELLRRLRARYPQAVIVMATMLDERPIMTQAFESGCNVFLVKPHGFMELFERLKQIDVLSPGTLSGLVIDQYGPRPYRG